MDSEHRHELEENALAAWLAKQIDEIKPQLPTLLVLAIVALVVGIGYSYYNQSTASSRAAAWRDYTVAIEGSRPNINALRQAAFESPDGDVAEWSLITFADGRLFEAANSYLRNRSAADEAIREASEAYKTLVSARNEEISDRAVYGLARVYEMQGNLNAAREQYAKVRGPYAQIAAERAEQLELPRVQEDYAWITKTNAQPVDTPAEGPGLEADDIAMPEVDEEKALDDILESFSEPAAEEEADATETSADAESAPSE